jgi:hypothetical protein
MTRADSRTLQFGSSDDLSAYQQIWFTVKKALTDLDAAAVMQKTLGGGIVVQTDHSKANITINPSDTASLSITGASTILFYDIQTKDAAGNINTPQSGQLTVNVDITRS